MTYWGGCLVEQRGRDGVGGNALRLKRDPVVEKLTKQHQRRRLRRTCGRTPPPRRLPLRRLSSRKCRTRSHLKSELNLLPRYPFSLRVPKSGPFGPDKAENRTHDFHHDLSGPNGAGKAVFLLSRITETSHAFGHLLQTDTLVIFVPTHLRF